MQYLLIGVVLLVLGLVGARKFAQANPAVIAHRLRQLGGLAVGAFGTVLTLRGAASYGVPLMALALWLLSGHRLSPTGRRTAGAASGQTSRIVTDHLEMELDHDSGALEGRVLKGMFAGRQLEDLRPVEIALLWQDCRYVDPQSAQLLEAYLDRIHPTWRADMEREEAKAGRGPDGRMTPEEAYEILGLTPGATAEDVRKAHKALMIRLHPDRGGSTYLAAKVNEAKDVLLARL